LLALFSISSAHVYLTYPFVLSWSLLEAMASSCPVIGSATAPVEEVLQDGWNGSLVDFSSPTQLAEKIVTTLEDRDAARALGQAARETVVARYDLKQICLPKGLALLDVVASGGTSNSDASSLGTARKNDDTANSGMEGCSHL
jgi:glycosyltransferase involved in cell wall biosynthesis